MRHRIDAKTALAGLLLLTVAAVCVTPAFAAAETTPADSSAPAIDQETAQAILQQLKEIRRIVETIERQGLAERAPRRKAPQTASVTIGKDDNVIGAVDAPVTVVEFTDYQCPYCKRFVLTTFPLLKRDFIDSGKVRWVVRDMPLAFHGNARKAAQAAHCAADQHKFWEMREILFSNNAKLGLDDLPGYAQQIGLDTGAFGDCLASDRHVAQIEQESQEATRLGMRGTPSFVVGKSTGDTVTGRLVIGAQPAAVFTAEIKRALAQAAAGKKAPERKPAAGRTPEKKPAAG